MTDQTACRPGTIRTIGLPVGLDDLKNALEPTHNDRRRVIGHGDHLDEVESRLRAATPGPWEAWKW